jgi:exopolysaccharide biosynthesis predicted pyruvyltransferase EpsI
VTEGTEGRDGALDCFLAETKRKIVAALGCALGDRRQVALVDFPNHGNSGDSAIYVGEAHVFREMGIEVAYLSDRTSFSPRRLRRAVGAAPVLIHGGGNIGDIWPVYQAHREAVIQALPDNPIVQLPQSITFVRPERIPAFRAICRAHGNVTLLLRDEPSLAIAREQLGVSAELSPDMAFGMGRLRSVRPPTADVLWLARTDKETGLRRACLDHALTDLRVDHSVVEADWIRESTIRRRVRVTIRGVGFITRAPAAAPVRTDRLQRDLLHRLATARVTHAIKVLRQGRFVVTDRLHGHILATMLGMPHVIVDNRHGKLGNYFQRWTEPMGLARYARDVDEAVDQVRALLSSA